MGFLAGSGHAPIPSPVHPEGPSVLSPAQGAGTFLGHMGFPALPPVPAAQPSASMRETATPCWGCVFDSEPEHSCGLVPGHLVPGFRRPF